MFGSNYLTETAKEIRATDSSIVFTAVAVFIVIGRLELCLRTFMNSCTFPVKALSLSKQSARIVINATTNSSNHHNGYFILLLLLSALYAH